MRFRELTSEELSALEPDFIKFLSSNSVTADDWTDLKANKPEKVGELIAVFSEIVWDKVLSKAKHLEYRSSKELKVFFCGQAKLVLMGILANEDSNIDLADADCVKSLAEAPSTDFKIYSSFKDYVKPREEELFDMVEAGCVVTDEKLFTTLSNLYADQRNSK